MRFEERLTLRTGFFLLLVLGWSSLAAAGPITATLEGCVSIDDPKLRTATWFASGQFRAIAFRDPLPGCDPTIYQPIGDPLVLHVDRLADTMQVWVNFESMPFCGRVQIDTQNYLADDVIDPLGLKALVIDTGIACPGYSTSAPSPPTYSAVPEEPSAWVLIGAGLFLVAVRRHLPRVVPARTRPQPPHGA